MWLVQEKLTTAPETAWETESTYATEREAVMACADMVRREPKSETGEDIDYRVIEA